jgi:hypothetical protein
MDRDLATATYDSVAKTFNEDGNVPERGLRLVIDEYKKVAKVSRKISLSY